MSGLTAGALAVVSVLAMQASGSAGPVRAARATPTPRPTVTHTPKPPPAPPVPTTGVDSGRRVVYSIGRHRVWVVPQSGRPVTFLAQPGTVQPTPGVYYVGKRVLSSTGTDGAPIEHVIFFEYTAEAWIAFSSPVSDKVAPPPAGLRTGALRVHRADGVTLWNNTGKGSRVIIVK